MKDLSKAVELSCVVSGYNRKADQSLTIRLTTLKEAPTELVSFFDARHSKQVTVLIADDREAQARSYKGKPREKGQSPSQRLRNGIYNYWNHLREQGETILDFEEFYDAEMNEIIEKYI